MSLRPEGKTLISNDINGERKIPEGTYDIGDGFYDPTKRIICQYNGEFKRDLEPYEEQWITEKCRYNARTVSQATLPPQLPLELVSRLTSFGSLRLRAN